MSNRKHTLLIIMAAVLLTLTLSGCHTAPPASPQYSSETQETPSPTPRPTPRPTPSPTPEPTPEPYAGPELAEREKQDDEFFEDAVFFGNSLVDGLRLYGGLEHGDFCAMTSASVVSVTLTKNSTLSDGSAATQLQTMLQKQYGKIYILLGINEIGFEPDYFIEIYSGMLDEIAAAEPEADIYIMSLTPITEKRSSGGGVFTMERVDRYNEALKTLAQERECYYIDLVAALGDENGYLPEEDSTDGIHMQAGKYTEWADCLRTHYAD